MYKETIYIFVILILVWLCFYLWKRWKESEKMILMNNEEFKSLYSLLELYYKGYELENDEREDLGKLIEKEKLFQSNKHI